MRPRSCMTDDLSLELPELRRLLRHVMRDLPDHVDDVCQETMLDALRAPPSPTWPLERWLRGVARNRARMTRRSEARRRRRESSMAPASPPADPAIAVSDAERMRRVTRELALLPAHHRDVIEQCFFDGLTPSDLAARMQVPAATARSRLHRAVAALRRRVAPEEQERRDGRLAALLAWRTRAAPTSTCAWRSLHPMVTAFAAVLAVGPLARLAWVDASVDATSAAQRVEQRVDRVVADSVERRAEASSAASLDSVIREVPPERRSIREGVASSRPASWMLRVRLTGLHAGYPWTTPIRVRPKVAGRGGDRRGDRDRARRR